MADKRRLRRLETAILHTVAPMISHGLADPRLSMITVTNIRLSADLAIARVNWSCMGGEADRSKATHALENARGALQGAVGRSLKTRVTPRLEFHFDESLERSVRINEILDTLAAERREREGVEEEEGDEAGATMAEANDEPATETSDEPAAGTDGPDRSETAND